MKKKGGDKDPVGQASSDGRGRAPGVQGVVVARQCETDQWFRGRLSEDRLPDNQGSASNAGDDYTTARSGLVMANVPGGTVYTLTLSSQQ